MVESFNLHLLQSIQTFVAPYALYIRSELYEMSITKCLNLQHSIKYKHYKDDTLPSMTVVNSQHMYLLLVNVVNMTHCHL